MGPDTRTSLGGTMRPSTRSAVLVFALTLASIFAVPEGLDAQKRCVKGKPCGNTCIARSKTCRVGTGSARQAPVRSSRPSPASAAVPEDARYVASSRGTKYYWIQCSAWRSLSPANRIFFKTRSEAEETGYTPSAQRGCAGPAFPSGDEPGGDSLSTDAAQTFLAEPCLVSRVIDGDTIDCADGRRIRLLLIDAPEAGQGPFGAEARAALEGLAPPGTRLAVETDVEKTDRYGRSLAHLLDTEGRSINRRMLEMGMAVVSVYPPNVRHVEDYRRASDIAKEARVGLWSVDAFRCLPADFRAGRCGGGSPDS